MIETPPLPPAHRIVHGDHGLFADCPDCNARDFLVDEARPDVFVCLSCDSRWRYALGYVWRIAPDQPELGVRS